MKKGNHKFSRGGYMLTERSAFKHITTPIPLMPKFKRRLGTWKGTPEQAKARKDAGFVDNPVVIPIQESMADAQKIQDALDRS